MIVENESYSKIAGKKTLILVITIIALIILLSGISVFLIVRRSSILTNSVYYEKPIPTVKNPTTFPTSTAPVRTGD